FFKQQSAPFDNADVLPKQQRLLPFLLGFQMHCQCGSLAFCHSRPPITFGRLTIAQTFVVVVAFLRPFLWRRGVPKQTSKRIDAFALDVSMKNSMFPEIMFRRTVVDRQVTACASNGDIEMLEK